MPLVRRNAVEVRNAQFGQDAEALVEKIRAAIKGVRGGARADGRRRRQVLSCCY